MSRIDIVVPCYKYAHFLKECVDSVLSQSLDDVRVLIINDASPDCTDAVATALSDADTRVFYRRHEQNSGHIATYNEGLLDWARADYSLLLSADDYLLPGALARAVQLMDLHPDVGFTFGPAIKLLPGELPPATDVEPPATYRVVSGLEFVELSGPVDIVHTPTAVVRTKLQQRLGGYRADLPHAGDMEMWLRFAAHGAVGIIDAKQAVYRRHETNMSLSHFIPNVLVLPDLQQRKAVFEVFFKTCGQTLADYDRLLARTVGALAEEAAWEAHLAFERGQLAECDEIMRFAWETYPGVRYSRPGINLMIKRALGLKVWSTVGPALDALRRVVSLKAIGHPTAERMLPRG